MSRLIPGLPTDVFKKVDDLIADVKPILVEVDTTPITVSTTLTDVDVPSAKRPPRSPRRPRCSPT